MGHCAARWMICAAICLAAPVGSGASAQPAAVQYPNVHCFTTSGKKHKCRFFPYVTPRGNGPKTGVQYPNVRCFTTSGSHSKRECRFFPYVKPKPVPNQPRPTGDTPAVRETWPRAMRLNRMH